MWNEIRKQFPILKQKVNGKPLIYLDSAATAQKPLVVIEALDNYYRKINANVHRSAHFLATAADEAYESARDTVQKFLNAKEREEIIFTRGATNSLNIIARSIENWLSEGDEIIVSMLEHHSNFIPWQQLAKRRNLQFTVLPLEEDGSLSLELLKNSLSVKTKIVALAHASNTLGTINPIKEIAQLVHGIGAYLVVDGAQSVPHMPIDVEELEIDFLAFSGHKLGAPTGIGVLYGRKRLLEKLEPIEYGGGMMSDVTINETTWNELPWKFEAGTPIIAGAIGLKAAIDFLQEIGLEKIHQREQELVGLAHNELKKIEGIRILGPLNRTGLISFTLTGVHPHDIATVLDGEGIAIRAGHHCTQILHQYLGLTATSRASFYLYNDESDVLALVKGIKKVKEYFRV